MSTDLVKLPFVLTGALRDFVAAVVDAAESAPPFTPLVASAKFGVSAGSVDSTASARAVRGGAKVAGNATMVSVATGAEQRPRSAPRRIEERRERNPMTILRGAKPRTAMSNQRGCRRRANPASSFARLSVVTKMEGTPST
jgi:hypothetical protein